MKKIFTKEQRTTSKDVVSFKEVLEHLTPAQAKSYILEKASAFIMAGYNISNSRGHSITLYNPKKTPNRITLLTYIKTGSEV